MMSYFLYGKYNYPIYCFLTNPKFFTEWDQEILKKWRIKIIQIPPISSLDDYSKFWIHRLVNLLPPEVENIIGISPDSFLLKSGIEKYVFLFSLIYH